MIRRSIDVEVVPDSIELAECFCEMSAREQAIFFNRIKMISDTWDKPVDYQLSGIVNSTVLDDGGREIMSLLGEYANEKS